MFMRAGAVALIVLALAIGGCTGGGGGGGGSQPPAPNPPPGGSGPTWTQNVFQPASTFEDRCEIVRTGLDFEGNPFPDRAGSLLLEKFWLRSWTNETYLWNNEVVDRDPASFGSRLSYFAVLKTTATTPSGRDKDEFHFSQPTDQYLRERNSAPRASYGARFVLLASSPPRDIRVAYTEPNSPASAIVGGTPNLVRGSVILKIDGIDAVNAASQAAVDALNAALFPATAGESHTFEVRDPITSAVRTITLTAANLASKPVNRTAVIDQGAGKVGYILFNTFSPFASESEIVDAIAAMSAAGVSDLVLDLRYNGGGLLAVASQLSYMTAGAARTAGRDFERLRFNASAGNRDPVTGQINTPVPFYSQTLGFSKPQGQPLPTLNLGRVYVLTTSRTCSASESVINALRGVNVEVVIIGSTTCGKPFGFYPTSNCGETYYSVQFQGVNDIGFGDYADGFAAVNSANAFAVKAPGCAVADTFFHELGDPQELLLKTALEYRQFGACPSPSAVGPGALAAGDPPLLDNAPGVFDSNRDMRMPGRPAR